MNQFPAVFLVLAAVSLALAGCGRPMAIAEARSSHEKGLPSFKDGKGLALPEETRRSIGLEIAEVTERNLLRHLTAEVQVYEMGSGAVGYASGLVGQQQADWLYPGQPVSLTSKDSKTTEGKLRRVGGQTQPVPGQTEIVVEMPVGGSEPTLGTFFTATLTATNKESVTTVPRSALLRAAQGDFVYVANGERFLRTSVTVGDEAEGFVQIKDGLYAGDKVVIKPVHILWLTELRLARAGGDAD